MKPPLRIANCSGFYGDRISAAREMVEGGPIDVLTGDWLAELTMLILGRSQAKRPGGGYARTFVTQMEQVMGTCLDRGIKVVANAGGLDPVGCAEAIQAVAEKLGLSPTIGYVTGDNILSRLNELVAAGELTHFETGEAIRETSEVITANVYLGCWGIVEALSGGADIVVTGRTTDAAIVCGPAAWYHGWRRDDWDALAGAVAAGHVIECGTQATGGNYSFFTELPRMERTGFPWAEIAGDGSSVIGKHDDTGGEVCIGTVTSQLLYEIGGPRYLGPDVTTRFDTIRLEQIAPNRVKISGTRGEPPPPTLKVAINEIGGYRNEMAVALTGLDIEAKAALVEKAFWTGCPFDPEDFASVTSRLVRTDKEDPPTNEEAVAEWRIILKDPDERKVGRAVSNVVTELGLATIPGFFLLSGGPREARSYGVFKPALVPAKVIPQYVVVNGEGCVVESSAPPGDVTIELEPQTATPPAVGQFVRLPLGSVVGTRSGDKGGTANLGVFVRSQAAWAWMDEFLTIPKLKELLPETAPFKVDRFRFPALWSLNFVVYGLLEEGVAASTRLDGQAKSLGEWLRAREVEIPEVLIGARGDAHGEG